MAIVKFSYADRRPTFTGKRKIQKFVVELFKEERKPLEHLTYIFCSDEFLLKINSEFLRHDDYTDIITFDLSEGEAVLGEVYISIDRVQDNARLENTSFNQEVLRVIFHGALHLCGYTDKKKRELTQMREKEDHYLRLFEKIANDVK